MNEANRLLDADHPTSVVADSLVSCLGVERLPLVLELPVNWDNGSNVVPKALERKLLGHCPDCLLQ